MVTSAACPQMGTGWGITEVLMERGPWRPLKLQLVPVDLACIIGPLQKVFYCLCSNPRLLFDPA